MAKKCKKVVGDLALEFKILGDQIKDSTGEVKKTLEKERNKVVEKYKKELKKCKI